jgi:hypothetical protein
LGGNETNQGLFTTCKRNAAPAATNLHHFTDGLDYSTDVHFIISLLLVTMSLLSRTYKNKKDFDFNF